MPKLIALDDGHGMETAGKRTPVFPAGSQYTGKFMHENEFNRSVVDKLKVNLERCGFKTLLVAAGDSDVPLSARTSLANASKADIYISVHANALNGVWGNQQGVSTYHYPGAMESARLAKAVHTRLLGGTTQKDRGILTENFHVLRETKMPSVLVEAAFMDNQREAELLMSDSFRQEVADEIAKGVCDYFAVPYTAAVGNPTSQDVVAYAKGKILQDDALWLKKATSDSAVYHLLLNFMNYKG